MNKREGAVITAVTGVECCEFKEFHKYAEEILERPVFTHELADEKIWELMKEKAMPEFIQIMESQNA